MSKSTVMALIRYSIVIMLLAVFLFFWLDVWEPGFVPVCMTMVVCAGCFVGCVLRLMFDGENPISKKRGGLVLAGYFGVCLVLVAVKCGVSVLF